MELKIPDRVKWAAAEWFCDAADVFYAACPRPRGVRRFFSGDPLTRAEAADIAEGLMTRAVIRA